MFPLHPHDPPSIGPYRTLGRLGGDDTARHYVGRNGGGALVTVVLLRPGRATDPVYRAEFARRVRALRRLRSPYVCRLADADVRSAVPWAAFTRRGAESLAALTGRNGGVLPPEVFPAVAASLAAGLADLHGVGVAHGALRAEGVLLVSGTAVLAEAVCADPTGGAAEDVRHWAVLVSAVAGDAGPPLRFRRLIEGCLHPDPALRPTPRELVRMLEGASAGPEAPKPTTGGGPRRRVRIAVAAGALAVATAATAIVAARDERADSPEAVTTDCTEAEGFPPPDERSGAELDVAHMVFSPEGDLLAVSSSEDGLSVWDWRESREVARLREDLLEPGSIGFLPEGCALAAVVPDPGSEADIPPSTGTVFDLVAGTSTEHRGAETTGGPDGEESLGVSNLAVSPGGLLALSGWHDDGGVRIVDPHSGEVVGDIETAVGFDGGRPVFVDERRLALTHMSGFSDWGVTVWDVLTGERLHTVRPVQDGVFDPVPGTDRVVYPYGGELIVQDFVTGTKVDAITLEGATESVDPWLVAFAVDPWLGRVYVTWTADSSQEGEWHSGAWDLESGEDVLPEGLAPLVVAPHPGGEVVAVKAADGQVRFLDPLTWETVGTL